MGQCEKRRSKAVTAARVLLKVAGFLLHVGPIPAKLLSAEKFLPRVSKALCGRAYEAVPDPSLSSYTCRWKNLGGISCRLLTAHHLMPVAS